MINITDKHVKSVSLLLLSISFLVVGITSIAHTVKLWEITNEGYYPYFLAAITFVGVVISLLLGFLKSNKLAFLRILVFTFTIVVELAGNILYSYSNIDMQGDLFINMSSFLRSMFDNLGFIDNFNQYVKAIMAFIFGSWIPLFHVLMFSIIRKLVQSEDEEDKDKQAEQQKEDVIEEKEKKEDKVQVSKKIDNKKKLRTKKTTIRTWRRNT